MYCTSPRDVQIVITHQPIGNHAAVMCCWSHNGSVQANFEFGLQSTGVPYQKINHSPDAIAASWYLAMHFLNECRKNDHAFPSTEVELNCLSYGRDASELYSPRFVEAFIFPSEWSYSAVDDELDSRRRQRELAAAAAGSDHHD